MIAGKDLLDALPVAVYTTDADGRITAYNDAAAALWGRRPEPGELWCGSWRLYWPDGRPMAHDECPMAICIREGRPVRGMDAIAERPDGTRIAFLPYPSPLKDASGQIIGAINVLIDMTRRKERERVSAQLAAIVAGSDDAIVSKTLDGRITSWNAGASRIFGYEAEEMIGQPITRIIPPELLGEEEQIIAKLKRGERIDHFDTVRVAKDGRRINISLTISPLRDAAGAIVGASKVARDVTERKRAEELQALLFEELNHRVKNTLATIQALASQSLRRATSPSDFVFGFNGRIQALARAHDLLVESQMRGAQLAELVREQVLLGASGDTRISCSGPLVMLDARMAVQLGLVLHELATNARKYGALSLPDGRLSIDWTVQADTDRTLMLTWKESGVPKVSAPSAHGFGTTLIERTLQANGGAASIRYDVGGITCVLSLPLPEEDQPSLPFGPPLRRPHGVAEAKDKTRPTLRGRRILVVEDEALVALEMETELSAAGCVVVGPVGTLQAARRLIADAPLDGALVDANLAGQSVEEILAALTLKSIPFALATGYGTKALPRGVGKPAVLVKPFSAEQLLSTVEALLGRPARGPSHVVSLEEGKR